MTLLQPTLIPHSTMVLSSLSGPTGKTSDLVIGESIKGETTNSCAIVGTKVSVQDYIPY